MARSYCAKSFAFMITALFVFLCGGLADNHNGHKHHHHHLARHGSVLSTASLKESQLDALSKRDDYSCGPGNPCGNGACCGTSGYCGYGPTYCGSGNCTSNCDAVAECGQYAASPGKQCPLNTCCSQYGFCGTTTDFCGTGCQSNCVLNPTPPGGGSSLSILENKVIGYYESWSSRLRCHQVAPKDLPLDALTHINFAFAYIDPSSYEVVTMDTSTPSNLFQDTAGLKGVKQDLKVFVSVGGWSFSDNGTATQPLYGEIAASATKRQTFANNIVQFMTQYGFDGLDIDWEYPGAPDRGGQSEDTDNFVLLLQTLRQTFDQSGNDFGLTFTAPSSYWYLRWFDLPKMIKYADWINLMSYDLHGVWDSTDPLGSIVQAHTNLTEIKLAAELFWRVNIPPAKIVLGFGFYGRSFTLASQSCTTPGCPFSGASSPGPCSNTGGILAHYEIQAVLAGDESIKPTQDKEAAVMYFTFDNDQWVSYDNAATFKQKVDWANSVGLGGSMIWASDLDDDKYTAHAGLLGRAIQSTPSLQATDKALSNPQAVIIDVAASNGQACFAYKGSCVDLNDNNAMAKACGAGFTVVGWDDAGCGKKKCHCGKPICCPTNAAPKDCTWRGDHNGKGASGDCSAQCFTDEINIQGIVSSWGGGFTNDGNTNKCVRGRKAFCCPARDYTQSTSGCGWSKCRAGCPTGKASLLSKVSDCFIGTRQYCCPDNSPLSGCHWTSGKGAPDCANAVCSKTEIEIDRDEQGNGGFACNWGRKKAACCTVVSAPAKPAYCSANLCTTLPGFCPNNGDDESANGFNKRHLYPRTTNSTSEPHHLEKRGSQQDYRPDLLGVIITALAYPSPPEYIAAIRDGLRYYLRRFFGLVLGYCDGPNAVIEITIPQNAQAPPPAGQVEHIVDRGIIKDFSESSVNYELPGGAPVPADLVAVPHDFWKRPTFKAQYAALAALPPVGGPDGAQPGDPNSRIMECFGTYNNPYPLMLVEDQINGAKGRAMQGSAPTDLREVQQLINRVLSTGRANDADALLESVRIGFAVFDYLNTNEGTLRWNNVRNNGRLQWGYIQNVLRAANILPANVDLQRWWEVWWDAYFNDISNRAQLWANTAIRRIGQAVEDAANQATARGEPIPESFHTIQDQLVAWTLSDRDLTMRTPPSNTFQGPQPPGGAGGGGGGGAGGGAGGGGS